MALSVFQEMDGWVSGGLFSGMMYSVMVSWIGVFFMLSGMDSLWKTRLSVAMEYAISLYADLYRSVIKGFGHYIVTVGCTIFSMGMAGLVPGVVSWVQQLTLPLLLAFCSWTGIVFFGFFMDWRKLFAMFIPRGVPRAMGLMMSHIELASFVFRPWVLCVRLLVNMIIGGVIIYVLGVMCVYFNSIFLLLVLSFFILYEIAVCFFQSYVFSMLLGLYMKEVDWFGESSL